MNKILELAKFIHYEYEKIAEEIGWKTQKKCQVLFEELPKENKQVMLKIAESVYKQFISTTLEEQKQDIIKEIEQLEKWDYFYCDECDNLGNEIRNDLINLIKNL